VAERGVSERSLDAAISEALERLGIPTETFMASWSRPLSIVFAVANTQRDVAHRLGVKPDGFLVVHADARIKAVAGKIWTRDLAFLEADADNARAIVIFYTLREATANA
jgi:hypothetical protein